MGTNKHRDGLVKILGQPYLFDCILVFKTEILIEFSIRTIENLVQQPFGFRVALAEDSESPDCSNRSSRGERL